MFRFVAFAWDRGDRQAKAAAGRLGERLQACTGEWAPALETEGLAIHCHDIHSGSSGVSFLHNSAGAVLGRIFAKGKALDLNEDETALIVDTLGSRLISHYWGRYVAFIQDAQSGTTVVVRDPTSGLPCFHAQSDGLHIFFSHMDEGVRLVDRGFSINWDYVRTGLCKYRNQLHTTGLNEVTQILGGERWEISSRGTARRFLWNVLNFARADPIETPEEAAGLLYEQTRECVHAWASTHSSIVYWLSGGLDSSIVASCLNDAPMKPSIVALNYYSPGSNTDERGYAGIVAQKFGFELVTRRRIPTLTLDPLLDLPPICVPTDFFFLLDRGQIEYQLAAERGATAIFSGWGGDALFFQTRAKLGAEDYCRMHGLDSKLFTIALDAAHIDKLSLWAVLFGALRARLSKPWHVSSAFGEWLKLLKPEAIEAVKQNPALVHPCFRESLPGVPSGKVFHGDQLLYPMEFYHPIAPDSHPEHVAPLFSQPLFELIMRIPIWVLTVGGWDRAIARRAFQHDVPKKIITRRTKGGQEEHARSIIARNIDVIRDLLLDGHLVRQGMLDEEALQDALGDGLTTSRAPNTEIFSCLSMEAWIRSWQRAA